MATRKLPQSMTAALRVLRKCRDKYQMTPVPAERAVGAEISAQLDPGVPGALLTTIERELGESLTARAQVSPKTLAKTAAGASLRMVCSHFLQVLDFGIARGRWNAGVRVHFERPSGGGPLPAMVTDEQVSAVADRIVKGEALRMASEGAAHVPMVNPSAAEVAGAFSNFRTAVIQAAAAAEDADDEAEDVSALTNAALVLAVDVFDSVEFFYRKDTDGGSFRRKCRRWGVEYEYAQGEPVDDPKPQAPGAPVATVGSNSTRQVSFTWDAVTGAIGYRIYGKGPGSGAPILLGQFDGLSGTVAPELATSGEDWLFTLTAFNDSGESDPSPEVAAALP